MNDAASITDAIGQLFAGPLTNRDAIHVAETAATADEMPHGLHCHNAWELVCPLRASMLVATAGRPTATIPHLHLLMIPPGCLHVAVHLLAQPPELSLLVMNLPGEEFQYGGMRVDGTREWLSPVELAAWRACLGADPTAIMEQVAQALEAGVWGRERALGLLRILVAAYAEVTAPQKRHPLSMEEHRVAEAQLFLQSNYYEPTLSVETVAASLGLSASHLSSLFRKTTGRTLHQTLIDIRLRRATDLLVSTTFSIKEIAMKTGWSNQLYFSAAYRRHHGQPPSAVRPALDADVTSAPAP